MRTGNSAASGIRATAVAALVLATPLGAQTASARVRVPDGSVAGAKARVATDTAHRPWMVYSYTDFYFPHHVPVDTATLTLMASRVDRLTNGDPLRWRRGNPRISQIQYRLFWFLLASSPDTLGASGIAPLDEFLVAHGFPIESAFLHRKDSTITRAHRMTWVAHDGDTAVALNPADPGMRAYQADVFAALIAGGYRGVFYDVFGRGGMARAFTSAEGDSTWYRDQLTQALRAERAPFPGSRIMINTGSYDTPFDSACIVAAGAAHLELTNYPLGFNLTRYWRWVDKLVASGVQAIEFVSNLAWFDNLPQTYSAGNDTTPRGREKMAEYESYQLVRDSGGVVSFAPDNYWRNSPGPDWLAAWEVDVGQPIVPRHTLVTGKDPLGQGFTVWARATTRALVLLRPGDHATNFGDASAIRVSLGSPYRALRSDGVLGAPTTTIALRAGEGAILVPGAGR